jgi:hypothetical protein
LHFARIRFYQPIGRGKRIEIQNHSRDLPVGGKSAVPLLSRGSEVASAGFASSGKSLARAIARAATD